MQTDPFDTQVMDLVKEINPSGAYLMGFNEYAGMLFIASKENVEAALSRVRNLRVNARTELQRKVLDSLETALLFDEPQPVLDDIVGTVFALLAKEGVNDRHMMSLFEYAGKGIQASRARYEGREIPVPVKALTLYRLDGVLEILDTVKAQTKSQEVKDAADALKVQVSDYVKLFELDGWGKGEFPNAERIFAERGFDLRRQGFYLRALSKGFDYSETPEQLEERAIGWIDDELPRFKKATEKLARKFGCTPTPEEVEKKINEKDNIDPKKLVGITLGIRRVVQRLVNEDVSGVNPRYRTTLIETPSYLTGTIPTGAAQFFDTFTKKPFQYFFQTTDPKRDPDKSVAALLGLLVHEEYGHCLHHSNSAMQFVRKLSPVQLLGSLPTGAPITEGLSFNREIEFLEVSKGLETKKRLTRTEKDYVRLLEKHGGLKEFNLELEFMIMRMRIIRFLRVVGDVRINTGKQGLIEFVDWAHGRTGIPRSSVYFQLFPAHEGIFPGYATSYAVCGQKIRAIEKKIKDPKKRVKFSTYLCSIGFPPMSIYMRMLKEHAAKLK
ncbi:MAG: hypothetical protein JRN06_04445 [Nitrososphaerota archaeon]|nr:hypothetical protein [Nitrososphaerota archaeon]MDG7023871.1 hypothetical protein [Nitrososphaerota archaeon]